MSDPSVYHYKGIPIRYRAGSDDDRWVIPETLELDVFGRDQLVQCASRARVNRVFDLGAHIGVFSALCLAEIPNAFVRAWECMPANYSLLEQNLAGLPAEVNPRAISWQAGLLQIGSPDEPAWNARHSHFCASSARQVPCDDLNSILAAEDQVFLLKADLEGYEAPLLDNLREENLRKIKVLLIEEHAWVGLPDWSRLTWCEHLPPRNRQHVLINRELA